MIRQADALTYDQPEQLTAVDHRMNGALEAGKESGEVTALRQEIRRMEDLVAHFRTTMGNGFFLTIQHAATLDGMRKELGAMIRGPETAAQREARLDSEADETMDRIAAVLMGRRNENSLVESNDDATGPVREQTIDELEAADDEAMANLGTRWDSVYG